MESAKIIDCVSISNGKRQYLSDIMPTLPLNCLFDKGRVGAGGTSLAIMNDLDYVIAVPYLSLIQSKCHQHDGVLGVHGSIDDDDIRKYIKTSTVKKIMVTYDSLERLMKFINPANYYILIDEYHLLFTEIGYREEAVYSVLDNYKKFKGYTFMTATPLEEDFILEELKDIPIVKCVWDDESSVTVHTIKCKNKTLNKTVIETINSYLLNTDEESKNLHIFVNSIEFISLMAKNCNLDDENTRAVWSKNNPKKIQLTRSDITDPVKKINFYTSSCFEGCDIYDPNGIILVVSDNAKPKTLIDISTRFTQIAARIRNSKYLNNITFIYNESRYCSGITYDEFKAECNNRIVEYKGLSNKFNGLDNDVKKYINIDGSYIKKDVNENFFFNPNLYKLDLYNFKVANCVYSIRVNKYYISNELQNSGFKHINSISNPDMNIVVVDTDKYGFEESVLRIKSHRDNSPQCVIDKVEQEELRKYPFILDAINNLGFDGIKNEKYVISNIKRKLVIFSLKGTSLTKILRLINTYDIKVGSFISLKESKRIFSNIYMLLKIKRKATGSDIERFFFVSKYNKRIGGKLTAGYLITGKKAAISDF